MNASTPVKSRPPFVLFAFLTILMLLALALAGIRGYRNFSKLSHLGKAVILDEAHIPHLAFDEYLLAYFEDPSESYVHYRAVEGLQHAPRYATDFYNALLAGAEKSGDQEKQRVFRFCLGRALSFFGRYDDAIELIEPHVSEKSDDPRFLVLLGRLYSAHLDRAVISKGEAPFLKAISLDKVEQPRGRSGYAAAYFGLSALYLKLGRFKEALHILEHNMDRLKGIPRTDFFMSLALMANLDLFASLKHFWLDYVKRDNFWLFALLALNSGFFWLFVLYFQDVYEPEPIKLVILVFLLGLLSSILVLAFYVASEVFLNLSPQAGLPWKLIYSIFFVGLFEELAKFLVVYLTIYQHREFDEMMDGIVYGGAAALGFSAIENFDYLSYGGVQLYLGRFFVASLGHLCSGGIIGYFMSLSKFKKGPFKHPMIIGFSLAVVLHGLYDFFFFMGDYWGWLSYLIFGIEIMLLFKLIQLAQKQSVYMHQEPQVERVRRFVVGVIRYEVVVCFFIFSLFLLWNFGFSTWMSYMCGIIYLLLGPGIFLLHLRKREVV